MIKITNLPPKMPVRLPQRTVFINVGKNRDTMGDEFIGNYVRPESLLSLMNSFVDSFSYLFKKLLQK